MTTHRSSVEHRMKPPTTGSGIKPPAPTLTEADVRRIVREEIALADRALRKEGPDHRIRVTPDNGARGWLMGQPCYDPRTDPTVRR